MSSGLIYLRNRYYDPSVGRFISEDPIRSGSNWYIYCGNNPIKYVDPWGLDHYVYYGNDQAAAAISYRQQLLAADPDTPVQLILVDTANDFTDGWSNMGFAWDDDNNVLVDADGNRTVVSIDSVIVNIHGSPSRMVSSNGETINLDSLDFKEMDTLLLLSCNTGNVDYSNNVASQLAMNQDVRQVIAPDGYNWRWPERNGNVRIYSGLFNGTETLALNGRTEGYGYSLYQNIGGMLFFTPGLSVDGQAGVFNSIADLIAIGQSRGQAKAEKYDWIKLLEK